MVNSNVYTIVPTVADKSEVAKTKLKSGEAFIINRCFVNTLDVFKAMVIVLDKMKKIWPNIMDLR